MNTLYIVSCGTRQRAVRLPAAQLYIGPLWNAAITHARHFAAREHDVRVLSARHGLLSQSHLLDPYDPRADGLTAADFPRLVAQIRGELPRGDAPLRVILLCCAQEVALWRAACEGTRFQDVPVRAPLCDLEESDAIRWMQSARTSIECNAPLLGSQRLSMSENGQLHGAARAAALWWSRHLMLDAPPPDASLFADALAAQLLRAWDEFYVASRGEWPEDLAFPVEFPNALDVFHRSALGAIGIDADEWWLREWRDRRLRATMSFSMQHVRVEVSARTDTIWRAQTSRSEV